MTSDSESRKSQDAELPQCWKDIKKETGFSTYLEYLEDHRGTTGRRHAKLRELLQEWTSNAYDGEFTGYCSIWDISGTGTLSRCFAGPWLGSKASKTSILTSLRNPDSDSILRVILLEPWAHNGSWLPSMTDVFGLGLRIVPEFFEEFLARSKIIQDYSRRVSLGKGSGLLGDSLITVTRDYLPGFSMYPPILLVMEERFTFEELQPVVFDPQGTVESRWMQSCKSFENIIEDSFRHYQSQTIPLEVALLHSLLPLLRSYLKQLKVFHHRSKDEYLGHFTHTSTNSSSIRPGLKHPEDAMEAIRFTLRRQLRRFEDCMSDFRRVLRDQHILKPEKYEYFSIFIDETHENINDVRALECEIRDWLQLRVGSLALEESKKSIEASNLQIEESKRGKIMKSRFSVVLKLTH